MQEGLCCRVCLITPACQPTDVLKIFDGVIVARGIHDVQRRNRLQSVAQIFVDICQSDYQVWSSFGDVLHVRVEKWSSNGHKTLSVSAEKVRVLPKCIVDRERLESQFCQNILTERNQAGNTSRWLR